MSFFLGQENDNIKIKIKIPQMDEGDIDLMNFLKKDKEETKTKIKNVENSLLNKEKVENDYNNVINKYNNKKMEKWKNLYESKVVNGSNNNNILYKNKEYEKELGEIDNIIKDFKNKKEHIKDKKEIDNIILNYEKKKLESHEKQIDYMNEKFFNKKITLFCANFFIIKGEKIKEIKDDSGIEKLKKIFGVGRLVFGIGTGHKKEEEMGLKEISKSYFFNVMSNIKQLIQENENIKKTIENENNPEILMYILFKRFLDNLMYILETKFLIKSENIKYLNGLTLSNLYNERNALDIKNDFYYICAEEFITSYKKANDVKMPNSIKFSDTFVKNLDEQLDKLGIINPALDKIYPIASGNFYLNDAFTAEGKKKAFIDYIKDDFDAMDDLDPIINQIFVES